MPESCIKHSSYVFFKISSTSPTTVSILFCNCPFTCLTPKLHCKYGWVGHCPSHSGPCTIPGTEEAFSEYLVHEFKFHQ